MFIRKVFPEPPTVSPVTKDYVDDSRRACLQGKIFRRLRDVYRIQGRFFLARPTSALSLHSALTAAALVIPCGPQ